MRASSCGSTVSSSSQALSVLAPTLEISSGRPQLTGVLCSLRYGAGARVRTMRGREHFADSR